MKKIYLTLLLTLIWTHGFSSDGVLKKSIMIGDYEAYLIEPHYSGDQIVVKELQIELGKGSNYIFDNVILDKEYNVLDSGLCSNLSESLIITDENRFKFHVSSIKIIDNSLMGSGYLYFPDAYNMSEPITIKEHAIEVIGYYDFKTKKLLNTPVNILNDIGLTYQFDKFLLFEDGIFIEELLIILDEERTIRIKNIGFSENFTPLGSSEYYVDNTPMVIAGWDIVIRSVKFQQKDLMFDIFLKLPTNISESSVYFQNVKIYRNNKGEFRFNGSSRIKSYEYEYKGLNFTFNNLQLLGNKLQANIEIGFPQNNVFGGSKLSGLNYTKITPEGNFQLSGSRFESFSAYEIKVDFRNIVFKDDYLIADGLARFPYDYNFHWLADEAHYIDTFKYNLDTQEVDFDIKNAEVDIKIVDNWHVDFSIFSITADSIIIPSGFLETPEELYEVDFYADEIPFTNMKFNLNTRLFSIEKIEPYKYKYYDFDKLFTYFEKNYELDNNEGWIKKSDYPREEGMVISPIGDKGFIEGINLEFKNWDLK